MSTTTRSGELRVGFGARQGLLFTLPEPDTSWVHASEPFAPYMAIKDMEFTAKTRSRPPLLPDTMVLVKAPEKVAFHFDKTVASLGPRLTPRCVCAEVPPDWGQAFVSAELAGERMERRRRVINILVCPSRGSAIVALLLRPALPDSEPE